MVFYSLKSLSNLLQVNFIKIKDGYLKAQIVKLFIIYLKRYLYLCCFIFLFINNPPANILRFEGQGVTTSHFPLLNSQFRAEPVTALRIWLKTVSLRQACNVV